MTFRRGARETVSRRSELPAKCLHSDLDVLLPKMGLVGAVELFFIVALTDNIDGEAISQRIRERLEEWEQVQQAGLTFKNRSLSKRL